MKKGLFSLIIGGLLFTSCYNNSVCFDVKNQSIKSCDHSGIMKIYLENDSLKEFYYINWIDSVNSPPITINLEKIEKGYNIYSGWNQQQVFIKTLKLSSSSEYLITRSHGDASAFKIKIRTDKNGHANWTSQPKCK